jgi:hypothetical protein
MALYKYGQFVTVNKDAIFDEVHHPGVAAPRSGIYRCENCRKEVASNQEEPLPSQNRHQHTTAQGAILWRLVVYAQHNPQ